MGEARTGMHLVGPGEVGGVMWRGLLGIRRGFDYCIHYMTRGCIYNYQAVVKTTTIIICVVFNRICITQKMTIE